MVVTRPREQAASLLGPLEALGAEVLLVPTIRIDPRPLDDEVAAVLGELATYQLVVFTSANAVRVFAGYLARGLEDGGMPAGPVVAAVGPATAAALERHGLACHLVPDEYVAEGLADSLAGTDAAAPGARVLIPCARDARDVLPETLRERGAVVDVLPIYDTLAAEELAEPAARVEAADFITFTSASTARRLAGLLQADAAGRGDAAPARRAACRRPALLHRPDHERRSRARPRGRGRGPEYTAAASSRRSPRRAHGLPVAPPPAYLGTRPQCRRRLRASARPVSASSAARGYGARRRVCAERLPSPGLAVRRRRSHRAVGARCAGSCAPVDAATRPRLTRRMRLSAPRSARTGVRRPTVAPDRASS